MEVDDRQRPEHYDWATGRTFHHHEDGRQPFSVEQLEQGLGSALQSWASYLRSSIAQVIANKYPGGHQKSYELEERLKLPKLGRLHSPVIVVTDGDKVHTHDEEKWDPACLEP